MGLIQTGGHFLWVKKISSITHGDEPGGCQS
jgi:hypothetical protein